MARSEFIESIDTEHKRISARFLEIDDIIRRLEQERGLMRERADSLDHVRELYLRTELAMQEINQAHFDISRLASNGEDSEFRYSREEPLPTQADLAGH